MGKAGLRSSFVLSVAVLMSGAAVPVGAQGQAALVIQGGTLIDGNGGAPVPNSVVVIQGNQITAAGPAAQVQVPAGAQVINAAGKFVLPGLWDAQASYTWQFGEAFLNWGVTSMMDIGLGGEVSIAAKEAVNAGVQRGPREFIGVAQFNGNGEPFGYETPFDGRQSAKSEAELVAHVKQLLDAGADMVVFQDGNWEPAWVKAACDLAHAANKPCMMRASGPKTRLAEAAAAGVDAMGHALGISDRIVRDGAMPAGNAVLDRFAVMDDAKAKETIDLLVREDMHPIPNLIHEAPGYPADWAQMQTYYQQQFSNPAFRTYYDEGYARDVEGVRTNTQTGAVRERRMVGYKNVLRFYNMLVAAGGKPLVGGDTNGGKVAGSILHEEMTIWQEAGIPRMKIIQAATLWPAETMRVANRIGTVTPGKLADVLIVNADPLADIKNLRNIDSVIQNGKVIERGFHASYSVPFPGHNPDHRYTIQDQQWVRALKRELGAGNPGNAVAPNPSESPIPAIESISPTMIRQNSPTTTLTLKGFGFVAGTQVLINGQSVPYTRVNSQQLNVTLDANLLRTAGRPEIIVKNPQPTIRFKKWGDGTSNIAYLIVRLAP